MAVRRYGSWTGSDTPAVFALLVIMAVFFIVGFFGLGTDLEFWLAWPISPLWLSTLKFWQMVTFPFVHNSIFSFIFDALIIFFFGGSLERAWGSARFVAFFFMCGIVAGLTVLGLTFLGMPPGFFIGMTGHFVGLGVAFGALNPYARIYIYFVLPIEGRWLGVISIFLELFVNYGSYGSPINAVIAIGVSALFAWTFTRGFSFGPRGGGGGPGFKERFERWRQRQRMRAWQRKVSQIDKPEDLFKP